MDFGELLHTAQRNEQDKKEIRYYSTKFSPPKKEQRNKSTLSVNVQKFLARKEAEEKHKQVEAKKKLDQLLELRSKDTKAKRRVNVMLKRTKSANQAVIEDALDNDNTAVTLAGPCQPDEDDYGYVSQEAASFYNKMMEKYSKMPEEPKFPTERKRISTNLSSTKDRVKAALEREKEEALLPHRRKRKHAESSESQKEEPVEVHETVERKEFSKPKPKAPPPMNFDELLKIAEKKQFEPIIIEQKKEEEERPLTKKQKKEAEREREWKERKEIQKKGSSQKPLVSNRIPKINGTSHVEPNSSASVKQNEDFRKIPKKSDLKSTSHVLDKNSNISKDNSKLDRHSNNAEKKPSGKSSMPPPVRVDSKSANNVNNSKLQKSKVSDIKSISSGQKERVMVKEEHPKKVITSDLKTKQFSVTNSKFRQSLSNDMNAKQLRLSDPKNKHFPPSDPKRKQSSPSDLKPKQFPPSDLKTRQISSSEIVTKQSRQTSTNGIKPKEFPPRDLKPKQFPPADVKRKEFPPKDVKRKPMANKRRILSDDEDEYDPEMDDFIDDGHEDEQDYSKYISEIFGYDKNRFKHVDDDIDNMESTFAQQMREECISTKIGIMEDLEDMKMEEETKKRKAMMKKKK